MTTPLQEFFAGTDPDDPISASIMDSNRREIKLWTTLIPDDDEDFASAITLLAARTGRGKKWITATVIALGILRQMPLLNGLQGQLAHLGIDRIQAITRVVQKVPSEFRSLIDARVTHYLTPTRPNQVLPLPASIAAMMRKIVRDVCPEALDPPPEKDRPMGFRRNDDGTTSLTARLTAEEAQRFKSAIEHLVSEHNVSANEALMKLLDGSPTKVTLHAYGSPQNPDYIAGVGWLTPTQQKLWGQKITETRDMAHAASSHIDSYTPTTDMKSYVRGRDETCRFPACNVDAGLCQIDHVIPWAEGGPTTPWNLQCLCQYHHNGKTDGRFTAYPLPNGDILWVLPDGSPLTTIADGPLAPSNRTWGTSYGDYRDRRTA